MLLWRYWLYGVANGQDFFLVWKSCPIYLSAEVLEKKIYCDEINFSKKNEYWFPKY
jgi:hypothetical protein